MRVVVPFLCLFALPAFAQEPTPLVDKIFACIDEFNVRDTTQLPWVRFKIEAGWRHTDKPGLSRVYDDAYGFLVSTNGDDVTIYGLDLRDVTLGPLQDGAPGAREPRHTIVDFAESVPAAIDAIKVHDARLLVLARICDQRGLKYLRDVALYKARPLAQGFRALGEDLHRRLMLSFGDPKLSLQDLLREHRRLLAAVPEFLSRDCAEKAAQVLERMTTESPAPDLTEVEGLIHALRDEFHPADDPESWEYDHITASRPPEDARPSMRLKRLGKAAYPALVSAMSDDSFTRTVGCGSHGWIWVHTVGDFARTILEAETGLEFQGLERLAVWRAWWTNVSERGEEAALAELARAGDCNGISAARVIAAQYPESIGAVIEGARHTVNRWWRDDLVEAATRVNTPEVEAFLREELERGPYISARVTAARALLDRGDMRGLEQFMKAWSTGAHPREKPQPDVPRDVADLDLEIAYDRAWDAMASLLLTSGRADAVRIVSKDVPRQPDVMRRTIYQAVLGIGLVGFLHRAQPDARDEVEREIERFWGTMLVAFMDDATKGSTDDAERIARKLALLWPAIYSVNGRAHKLEEMRTTWSERFDTSADGRK